MAPRTTSVWRWFERFWLMDSKVKLLTARGGFCTGSLFSCCICQIVTAADIIVANIMKDMPGWIRLWLFETELRAAWAWILLKTMAAGIACGGYCGLRVCVFCVGREAFCFLKYVILQHCGDNSEFASLLSRCAVLWILLIMCIGVCFCARLL